MKYFPVKFKKKVLKLPTLLGGLNQTKEPCDIKDNELSDCLNVLRENSILKTRPGLYTGLENIVEADVMKWAIQKEFFITDAEYFLNGKKYKIAYSLCMDDMGAVYIPVFLINGKREVIYIGNMWFSKTTDGVFYVPEKISFFVGKKNIGSGIYALTCLKNIEGEGKESRIFEVNSNLDGWMIAHNYYIPTVLINGRGNLYETAKKEADVSLEEPKELESQNILNSSFYAYYTSDGYSSNFRLPFSNIDNESIIIRVYDSLESYTEWYIDGVYNSSTSLFMGKEITVNVDREKGVIYFLDEINEYKIPRFSIYSENNIRILARKKIPNGFDDIASCEFSSNLGDRIIFSGGNKKNKIFSCRFDNPSYFPLNTENSIGQNDSKITALKTVKNKIFAFKEDKVYSIKIKSGQAVNSTSLVSGNDNIFYKTDKFEVECISENCGLLNSNAFAVCNDMAVWLSQDGYVYGYNNSVFRLTENIKPLSQEEISSAVAERFGENYILCYGNKAILINYNDFSSYFWKFPEEIKTIGLISDNSLCFMMLNIPNNICYVASLCGNEDIIISSALSNYITLPFDIDTYVATKSYQLGNFDVKAKISKILLRIMVLGDAEITLDCGNLNTETYNFEESDFSLKAGNYIKISPDFMGVQAVKISVSSKKYVELSSGEIHYTE